ncbi:MAG: hypothetical protein JW888_15745 [Pirellulales bacterium]|nr:hypothetical protein [Pirellulales bacterium]
MLRLLPVLMLVLLPCELFAENHVAPRRARRPSMAEPYLPPDRVEVLPVFLVARGEKPPSNKQMARLASYLQWVQRRYYEMLGRRDTFQIADTRPHVYQGQHDLAFYRKQPQNCAPYWTGELLRHYGVTRFTCPYVMVAVVMNPHDGFPNGGGRPLNGGFDTGGGIVILSSYGLMRDDSNFESTLEHELGHAFGLLHVNVYGYDMKTNPSIMSYDRAHHTKGFRPAAKPGTLIPEDIRALALNRRVFHKLKFDPANDVPKDYSIAPRLPCMGPMTIPGQADSKVLATTPSGEINRSSVANVVQGRIKPSDGPKDRFDPRTMWSSAPAADGLVSVELGFPMPVRLNTIGIHSQWGGQHDAALAVGVQAMVGKRLRAVAQRNLESVDDRVSFRPTKAKKWRLVFQAGPSRKVVIRGLQFFSGRTEIFPPLIPRNGFR